MAKAANSAKEQGIQTHDAFRAETETAISIQIATDSEAGHVIQECQQYQHRWSKTASEVGISYQKTCLLSK